MNQKPRVGIPQALSYYTFYPLWRTFLERLGAEVVVSSVTNREILEAGISGTVNDACIPVKVFHGHVFDLASKVDYLFVPRLISADGKATFCPKFLGLPDMIRFTGTQLPPVIDARYNLQGFPGGHYRFFKTAARQLGIRSALKVLYASIHALKSHRKYIYLLQQGYAPQKAADAVLKGDKVAESAAYKPLFSRPGGDKLVVALLGYPYAVFDPFINAGVYQRLQKMDVEIITYENIPQHRLNSMSRTIPQNFFWYYSNQVCWAGLYLLQNRQSVDGIIHITAFGCGPDAMVDKLLELESRAVKMPYISLSIDEHTGEGGVQTRLEAFVDMLRFKKDKQQAANS